jgi:Fe(3+) dicitrate transport protein
VRHKLDWDRLELTYGVRTELVWTGYDDEPSGMSRDGFYSAIVPGGGVTYAFTPELSGLVGVHKGFVPVAPLAPGVPGDPVPEDSINVEAGARWQSPWLAAEAIGFYSHYRHIKGVCSVSSGCDATQVDEEFDGGVARVAGAEATASIEPRAAGLGFPVALAYTFTYSEFLSSFDSDLPIWGDVAEGDAFSYIPVHEASLRAGVRGTHFEATAAARYVGEMRDQPGAGDIPEDERIDASFVVDLAGTYELPGWGRLYATVDNLLDEHHVVSRRPFGMRPGAPRLFTLGYKQDF